MGYFLWIALHLHTSSIVLHCLTLWSIIAELLICIYLSLFFSKKKKWTSISTVRSLFIYFHDVILRYILILLKLMVCFCAAFLGTCRKLGSTYCSHRWYEEEPWDYQWQNDFRTVLLLTALHEVCLQSATTQLAVVCVPFNQWIGSVNPGRSSHQIQNGEEVILTPGSREYRRFTAEKQLRCCDIINLKNRASELMDLNSLAYLCLIMV